MAGLTKSRSANGQFPKGQSGNPGGRPRDEQKVAELARSYTTEAIETLVELMRSGNDERVRGTAAQALLDRGWGKPKVEVVVDSLAIANLLYVNVSILFGSYAIEHTVFYVLDLSYPVS